MRQWLKGIQPPRFSTFDELFSTDELRTEEASVFRDGLGGKETKFRAGVEYEMRATDLFKGQARHPRPPSSSLSYPGASGNDDARSPGSGGTPGPLSQQAPTSLDSSDPGLARYPTVSDNYQLEPATQGAAGSGEAEGGSVLKRVRGPKITEDSWKSAYIGEARVKEPPLAMGWTEGGEGGR
ncbi:hypothetical protein KM043_009862 [Ampulex compressa]|nr:hypothetical protein KM043_009862 [Ampulex compressa]